MFAAETAITMRKKVSRFGKSANAFGIKINIKKTEMLYQPTPKALDIGKSNCINNEELASAQKFERLAGLQL